MILERKSGLALNIRSQISLHCSLLVSKDASNVPDAFPNHRNSFQIQSGCIHTFTQLVQMLLKTFLDRHSQFPKIYLEIFEIKYAFSNLTLKYWQTYILSGMFFPSILLCQTYFLYFRISWITTIISGFKASSRNSVRISYILYSCWYPVYYVGYRLISYISYRM